jgi:hypothetical protein|tara:strand:- start:3210 stop:3770 length:561 start_codon:yes stop_codon:yes gene_type:complete
MNYTTTFETNKLPKDIQSDINFLFKEIYNLKKDVLWRNYESYDYNTNLYTSVQYDTHGQLALVSGIHTRDFYPENTYRVFNRLARNPNARLGGAKTNNGSQPSHEMLQQQIDTVTSQLNGKFYFFSRQTKNDRWMNFYLRSFNETNNNELVISKDRYWITSSNDPAKGAQSLIYPKNLEIPFSLYI